MYERSFIATMIGGAGPGVVVIDSLQIPTRGEFVIEAWESNGIAGNAYIFEQRRSLADCQASIAAGGILDALLALSRAGVVRRRFPTENNSLTVFFDTAQAAGVNAAVQIVLKQVR